MDYPTIIAVLAVTGQIILIFKKEWLEDNHPRLYAVLKWGFLLLLGAVSFFLLGGTIAGLAKQFFT